MSEFKFISKEFERLDPDDFDPEDSLLLEIAYQLRRIADKLLIKED